MPIIGAYIGANLLNGITDLYMKNVEFPVVMGLLIVQFVYIFANRLVSNVDHILQRLFGELVVNNIKVKIMNKAKDIDLASFDIPEFYTKLENASREAGNRPIGILNSTFNIISTLISLVSFILILWAISPFAPLIIIAMSIPSAIVNFIYRRKNAMFMRRRSKDRRQMSYYSDIMTNKDMVKEVRMFGLSDLFIKRYSEVYTKYFGGLKKLVVSEGVWHMSFTIITSTINCLLFLFIAQKVGTGELRVGDYSLYTGALNSIANAVNTFITTTATIYEGTLFIDNLIAFMGEKKNITSVLDVPRKISRHGGHTIEFKNVSFRYPGTDRDVIKNVNLKFNPNETIVLVGLNGAGKTTLIKLLTRLYDPTEGEVMLDGFNIKDYDIDDLYRIFGIIFQDFGKYAVTVSENIMFGDTKREFSDEDIHKSAKNSNADVFIDKLPSQYETPLMRYFEENGIELSIGQWQKLAIARAFYSDSDIVILDEPTASLDAIAEQEIFNQFDSLRENKMTIFVSHRLSSATVATKIIVLSDGEIIEEGSHRELMELGGHYNKLFMTQAQRYIDSADEIKSPHK
jgi:ABC-type multidrug transport system fused ATPase/permease subunit